MGVTIIINRFNLICLHSKIVIMILIKPLKKKGDMKDLLVHQKKKTEVAFPLTMQ